MTASIQSIAAYMESNLNISVLGYIAGSVFDKEYSAFLAWERFLRRFVS